jgi:nucleoside-diphosphate-sugar epimerase
MKTILITGANGYIAQRLAARVRATGWRVVGTARGSRAADSFDAVYRCRLGDSLAPVLAAEKRIDALVHAANHAGPGEYEINTGGTLRWMREAREHSAPLQILLSSLSAGVPHPSAYGRAKRDLEGHFAGPRDLVVRLGLVLGYGGVFGRMIDSVRRLPVLPLLDDGQARVHVVNPGFLVDFLGDCVQGDGAGRTGRTWFIHEPTLYTLRRLLETVRRRCGSRCAFLPVPSSLILGPLVLVERIPFLRLPLTSSNVRGLRASQPQLPTDLPALGGREETLEALVGEATREALACRA